jgi:AraC-like DNA-binding protein
VRDGNVYTSAGVTSALDLALALVEDDHGPTLAREVAREMVAYLHRPADQAQISTFLAPPPGDRVVRDLTGYIATHLAEDLSPPALAARAGISTRHLARLFTSQWGVTPARAVRVARTEAAAHLVRGSELSLAAIARRCGFRSAETLRQAFLSHYGMTGDTIRRMVDMPPPPGKEDPETLRREGRTREPQVLVRAFAGHAHRTGERRTTMHRIFTKASLAVAGAAALVAAAAPATANAATAPVLYVEAAGLADCPAGSVCLWQHINYTGFMAGWRAGTYTPDFRTIKCSGCSGGNFNDDASSWANFTDRNYCVSDDINGGGVDNTMPVPSSGNFTADRNDRASSIGFIGCP